MVQTVEAEKLHRVGKGPTHPPRKLRVLDLFSGIGGFSLGLERSGGFETVAFCEIEPFCRRVLAKHWPGVPIYDDIRTLRGSPVDVVCGGFPCQPYSTASRGLQRGADDDRALWPEMLRVIDESNPAWVVGENVAGFDSLDLERVVSDLEARNYEVSPFEIPACAVGHDHWRPRIWLCAYTDRDKQPGRAVYAEVARRKELRPVATHARATHGLSARLDGHRTRSIGNAVVPQIPELIGRAITAALLSDGAPSAPTDGEE